MRTACRTAAAWTCREKRSRKSRRKDLTPQGEYVIIVRLIYVSAACGCSTTARAPAFQAGDAGSIPVTRSTKHQARGSKLLAFFSPADSLNNKLRNCFRSLRYAANCLARRCCFCLWANVWFACDLIESCTCSYGCELVDNPRLICFCTKMTISYGGIVNIALKASRVYRKCRS